MSSPETTDILMRLQCTTRPDHALVHEAADEIERLRARVADLERENQNLHGQLDARVYEELKREQ